MSEAGVFHGKLCTKCLKNERVFRQRWCRKCFTDFTKAWRAEQRAKREAMKARLMELENIMGRMFAAAGRNKKLSKGKENERTTSKGLMPSARSRPDADTGL